ncbi:MAG TPA: GNAT family N-acetyltransferase [Candidatus Limnocylindrales bacterium]|nr:GNAT family N-acetyltransferase [Candidatus Limnocylindrales bacterium]
MKELQNLSRRAGRADLDRATETVTFAFQHDPVWSVALARPDGRVDHHAAYWRLFVDAAASQGGVWMMGDAAAVSVWVPPGGVELGPDGVAALERFNLEWLGSDGARQMAELYERFDANHPASEPHAYLSLLATHPDHRGRGIGQGLLAEDLARWDAAGTPTYLESTNPANDHRYERAGFRRVGGFTAVRDGAPISTMWREVGGPGRDTTEPPA